MSRNTYFTVALDDMRQCLYKEETVYTNPYTTGVTGSTNFFEWESGNVV